MTEKGNHTSRTSAEDTAAVGGTLGLIGGIAAGWQLPELALAIGFGIAIAFVYRDLTENT